MTYIWSALRHFLEISPELMIPWTHDRAAYSGRILTYTDLKRTSPQEVMPSFQEW